MRSWKSNFETVPFDVAPWASTRILPAIAQRAILKTFSPSNVSFGCKEEFAHIWSVIHSLKLIIQQRRANPLILIFLFQPRTSEVYQRALWECSELGFIWWEVLFKEFALSLFLQKARSCSLKEPYANGEPLKRSDNNARMHAVVFGLI